MLLSERELNLSDNHEGIIEFSNLQMEQMRLYALDLNDPIFEVELLPTGEIV